MRKFLLAVGFLPLPWAALAAPSQVLVVDTEAHMVGLTATALKTNPDIYLLGYNAVGDGGGGFFHYSSASSATADSCVTFMPSAGSGRLLRQLNGAYLSALMCGAYNDGTHTAATLAALQAANDYVAASGSPNQKIRLPGPSYNLGSGSTGVVKASSFFCPNWVGDGKSTAGTNTIVSMTPAAETAIFTFVGGSGSICGGGVSNIVFEGNANTVGVELQGQGGATIDVSAVAPMERVVLLHNKLSGQFTEFNNLTIDTNGSTFGTVLEYRVESADIAHPSFHGSGLVGGVINYDGTDPAVLVGSTAFPYDAPLNATFFPAGGAAVIVQNNSNTAFGEVWFSGNIQVETGAATSVTIGGTGGGGENFFLNGGVTVLGADNWFMGNALTGRRFGSLANGQRVAFYDPSNISGAITGTTTAIAFPGNAIWNNYIVEIEVTGNNYRANSTAYYWWSEGFSAGTIGGQQNNLVTNTAGYGNIVIAPTSSGLNLTAASSAYVTGQNLKYLVTLTQIGQGSDHFIH